MTPHGWTNLRLRSVASIRHGGTPSADDENWGEAGDIPFVTPPDLRPVHGAVVHETTRFLTANGASDSTIAPAGSVIVSKRAPIGYVALLAQDSTFNQGCLAVIPRLGGVDSRFLTWSLSTRAKEMNVLGRGTTFMEMSAGDLADLRLAIPPLHDQHAVVDYLARETAKIDTLISKQDRLVDTLRERRAAVIEREFFGVVGKRRTSIRRVLAPLARPAVPELGVVTAYRDGAVTLRSNRRDDGYTFSDTEHGYQEVRPGDLVFHALDGFAGAVGIADSHGNATPVYHVCKTIAGDDPGYVAMLLRFLGTSGFLATQAPNVRQRSVDFRNWGTFARVPVALPPVAHQRQAVEQINEQLRKIDALIAKAGDFIQLAKERRAALITAAVNGQVNVGREIA